MKAMKAAGGYAISNAARTQPNLTQLVEPDNTVLPSRERRNCLVQRGWPSVSYAWVMRVTVALQEVL